MSRGVVGDGGGGGGGGVVEARDPRMGVERGVEMESKDCK